MVTVAEYQLAERERAVRDGHRGWAFHAAAYATIMPGLIILNLLLVANTDANFLWFPFPLVGWGVGLGMHYSQGGRWVVKSIRVGRPTSTRPPTTHD